MPFFVLACFLLGIYCKQHHLKLPDFACENGQVATPRALITSMSRLISCNPFPFCGSGPIVIKLYPCGRYRSPPEPGALPPNILTNNAPGPYLDQRVGRTYHGCRPFLSKLYNFVSGFGVSCTSLTARNEGRGRARYRRTNFREHRTRASTIERRRLGDSRLGTMSNHTLFLRVEMGAGLTQGWSS